MTTEVLFGFRSSSHRRRKVVPSKLLRVELVVQPLYTDEYSAF